MPQTKQQITGNQAEALACSYLQKQGLRLIERNYRIKSGEIDLIMQDKGVRVFIEVRCRFNPNYGSGIETVTALKRRRIVSATKHYLLEHNLYDKIDCRFDVIGIDAAQRITWIPNAF